MQGSTPQQLPSLSPSRGKCNYGTTTEAGKRPVRDRCPRTPPAQPGLRGTALPRQAGKEAENRFLFFHRVLGIYRPDRSGSFHPGHPERTGPRASLHTQPGAFLGWVNLPCARCGAGPGAGAGRGTELRDGRGFSPLGRGCALARQGQDQCKSILLMTLPVTKVMESRLEIGHSSLPCLQLIELISHPGQLSPAQALVASSSAQPELR